MWLLTGYKEVHRHFTPSMFSAGLPLRDLNLPAITETYVQVVLSAKNLAAPPGSPVLIPVSIISDRQLALRQYMLVGEKFRKFYFRKGIKQELWMKWSGK